MDLYPLKFHPILKEKLWGGSKLKQVLGKEISSDITGESWELSGVKGDVSIVSNGELKGTSLQELIKKYPDELLGKSIADRFGTEFPILIKFIDAQQDLSIQVHPNDELAKERHNSFGKTEMWYIMDADKDAELIIGFNKKVNKAQYAKSIEQNCVLDLLNYEKVNQGDAFFINAGKIHAIGAGVLLAEIQQTSDVTYRVFDFNRKDRDGNLRELHTDLALDALDYEAKDDFKIAYQQGKDKINAMVSCPYFTTNFLDLTKPLELDIAQRKSFSIYLCIQGNTTVTNDFGSVDLKMGETVLIPAATKNLYINTTNAKLLEVTI